MPQPRERRKAPDGTLIEWDGQGWLPVNVSQPSPQTPQAPPSFKKYGPMAELYRDMHERESRNMRSVLAPVGAAVGGIMGAPGGPAGMISGATLGSAGGEAIGQLVDRATGKPAPSTATAAATDIAKEGAIGGVSQAVGMGITGAMAKAAPWLMNKAVRPSAKLLEEYRMSASDLAKTLLDDGINVTQGGLDKLRALIFADNAEIQALVKGSNKVISKDKVLGRVDQYAADAMKSHVNPSKSLAKATKVADEFVEHPYYKGDAITPSDAQRLKVGTYQEIGDAFNKPQRARALKAAARGLKEEVADAVPGVAPINAREAKRMAAGEAVATRIGVDNSADPLGLLFAASNPQLFIAGLINRQPVIKSMLARGMYGAASRASGVPENVLRGAVYAVAEGQEDEN